jgi:uncharacterized membrane protein YecN with MAPEG domain
MTASDEVQTNNSQRCVAAALALSLVHILTIAGTDYQIDGLKTDRLQVGQIEAFQAFLFLLVNYGTFLSPVVVLFLIRKVCILVGIYAIPILIFFALRMHHVWQFYWFGINSMARQKGDELGWVTLIFEMLSVVIAAPWVFGILFFKLIDGIQRALRR